MEHGKEMARIAYDALEEKKGENTKIINISAISVIADYFIITTGGSNSQMNALVDNVNEKMHKAGYPLKQREGYGQGSWVLLDFGDVIVHVFDKENRSFYNLEHVWSDGEDNSRGANCKNQPRIAHEIAAHAVNIFRKNGMTPITFSEISLTSLTIIGSIVVVLRLQTE